MTAHNVAFGTNSKLGKTAASISRPVGPTCPQNCPFMTGVRSDGTKIPKGMLCYADKLEHRYPGVAKAWARGLRRTSPIKVYGAGGAVQATLPVQGYDSWIRDTSTELTRLVTKKGRRMTCLRIHVGGDFLRPDGELDKAYAEALCVVVRKLKLQAPDTGVWLYTHAWRELARERLLRHALKAMDVRVFASVHTPREARIALDLGYRLAVDIGAWSTDPGARVNWHDIPVTVCPHQRGKVPDCATCGFCFRPLGRHVGFILHR